MKYLLLSISLVFISYSFSQKDRDYTPEVFDSTQFLYEFDIKYLGESTTVDPNYQYVIGYLVELMAKNPQWTLLVRGHVCCGPSMKVSKKRACKAYKILVDHGVDKSRISYQGFNNTKPLAYPEKTKEDARINRRVDFLITK